jgi:hypothetical protein
VSGFLVFYLLTRIDLPPALAQADRLSVRNLERKIAEVQQTAEEVKQTQREQEERDVRALTLLGRQLTPEAGAPSIKQDELDEAIAGASPLVRTQIFGRAREQRRLTRKSDKVSMERAIPVFRALIASENERKFHRSHAQLGYPLLDQRQPDLPAAETKLTEAIELRNDANETGFLLYEFARALARIGQYRTNPSPELRAKIEADLKAAEASGSIRKIMAGSTEEAAAIKEFRADADSG